MTNRLSSHFISGIILLWGALAPTQAEVLYRSGFEADNESFGVFVQGPLSGQNEWKQGPRAEVSGQNSCSGSQSITPGSGDGRYGASIQRQFDFHDKREIWVDCMVAIAGQTAFVWVMGMNSSASKPLPAAYLFITPNGIEVVSGKGAPPLSIPLKVSDAWHRLTLRLDFQTQTYDLHMNDLLLKDNIPFHENSESMKSEEFSGIVLGGSIDEGESTVFYDDLVIATSSPLSAERTQTPLEDNKRK